MHYMPDIFDIQKLRIRRQLHKLWCTFEVWELYSKPLEGGANLVFEILPICRVSKKAIIKQGITSQVFPWEACTDDLI